MNEIGRANLTDQIKFRLNELTTIEKYIKQEINQKKTSSKKLIKYVAVFDYIDEALIVFLQHMVEFVSFLLSVLLERSIWNSGRRFYFNLFFSNRNN